jgi:hypothetical protein
MSCVFSLVYGSFCGGEVEEIIIILQLCDHVVEFFGLVANSTIGRSNQNGGSLMATWDSSVDKLPGASITSESPIVGKSMSSQSYVILRPTVSQFVLVL